MKIDELRKKLETAAPTEEEAEEARLDKLYAHARYLRNTAEGVTEFFDNVYGRNETWYN